MEKTAVFAGTFDPFTMGHYDVARRAAAVFDRLIVAVAEDSGAKRAVASAAERLAIVRASVADLPNVSAEIFGGFLTDFAARAGSRILVRGLRTYNDFEYEKSLFEVYRSQMDIEAVYIMTAGQYSHISGSVVRQLAALGGDVRGFVPESARAEVEKIYRKRG